MSEKRLGLGRACMIAVAVCIGAFCLAPSATAVVIDTHPPCPETAAGPAREAGAHCDHGKAHAAHHGKAHAQHGKAHVHHGKAHVHHGKAHVQHGTAHGANAFNTSAAESGSASAAESGSTSAAESGSASAPESGNPGRHLGQGQDAHAGPKPGNPGRHLGQGQDPHAGPKPGNPGRHLGQEPESPATKHARLLGTPPTKRFNLPAGHNEAPAGGRRNVRDQSPPQPAPHIVQAVRPVHQPQRTRVAHRPRHPSVQHPAKTNPTQPPVESFPRQLFHQLLRPGSPAMVLSLIVLMCLVGTAAVVSMARRKPARPTR